MTKKRRGPKPKVGVPRGKTGRIKTSFVPPEREPDIAALAQWQRAKLVIHHLVKDPAMSSPIGMMFFLGYPRAVTAAMAEAGKRAATALAAYDSIVIGLRRTPRGANLAGTNGSSLAIAPPDELVSRVQARYDAIKRTLLATGIPGCWSATERSIRGADVHPTNGEAELVHAGLAALVEHYGLDDIGEAAVNKRARRTRLPGEANLAEPLRV